MDINYFLKYIFLFIGSFIISYFINKIILKVAKRLGVKNKNDTNDRWSKVSKPSLGGFSLFFSFVFLVVFLAVFDEEIGILKNVEFFGLFLASSIAFMMGALDDRYCTKPLFKLFIQVLCGVIFIYTGSSIQIFHNSILDGVMTILWVVAVMNSLNMLDNMDGITGTVSFFILLACLMVFVLVIQSSAIFPILILAQLGALLGFLVLNIPPSKMFMGDGGSQFLALFVSYFGIKALWNLPITFDMPSWSSVFLILVAFTPAVVDTLTVMINRTKRGVSVMLGGKDHTTHHLVFKGNTEFKVWLIFTLLSTVSFALAVLLSFVIYKGYYFFSLIGLVFFLAVFIPLYRNTQRYHPPKSGSE